MNPSVMVQMSRAIRHVIEDNSNDPTLKGLKDEDLRDLVTIVGAFYGDLKAEFDGRESEP